MPLVVETIPNLLNGVSQQPPILRLPTQGDIQINGYSSVVEGLQKRPPTEHVAKLLSSNPTNVFVHLMDRDTSERYLLIIADGVIHIFDAVTGEAKTVNTTAPAGSYLDNTVNYRAVTINDFTFLVNTDRTCAMDTATTTAWTEEAVIVVDQAVENTEYAVDVDGSNVATFTTGAAGATNVETQVIATDLRNDLVANLPANYTITRDGSTIHIEKTSGGALRVTARDGYGDQAMTLTYQKTQRFTDLPEVAKKDMVVEIVGDGDTGFDNWFVKFVPDHPDTTIGRGHWVETVKPGIEYKYDLATMPHVIVRESNGTFTFRQTTDFLEREVGDTVTNTDPSFIGRQIRYAFFFQNRLGFLAEDNVILSEASGFFNFFRTTAVSLLDSDPIDIAAANEKVSYLVSAKAFGEELHLFGDQLQFKLDTGGALLSPKTVELKPTTAYLLDFFNDAEVYGRSVFLPMRDGQYAGVRDYTLQVDVDAIDAPEITEHVSKLIPGRLRRMTAATHEQVLVCLGTDNKYEMYVYKFFGPSHQRLQASWSIWKYCVEATEIEDAVFLDDILLLVVNHPSDGLYLEKIDIAPGRVDENGTFLTHLDRRVAIPWQWITYDPVTDISTIQLPFKIPSDAEDGCCTPIIVERPCNDAEQVIFTTTTTTTPAP